MARFSRTGNRWHGKRNGNTGSAVDPYTEASADHARRNREVSIDLGGGLVRVDAGEPIKAPGRSFKAP